MPLFKDWVSGRSAVTVADADLIPIIDADTDTSKKIAWSAVKTALTTVFDGQYAPIVGVDLPGTGGNYISTPDAAALDVVGDIDIRCSVALDDWVTGADRFVVAKYATTGDQRSYALLVTATGFMRLQWSTGGTSATLVSTAASTAAIPAVNGEPLWLRATLDVDNGASGNDVTYYTSTSGSDWEQLGDVVTTAGVTSIHAGTSVLELGSFGSGTGAPAAGVYYRCEIRSGIDGTAVANWTAGRHVQPSGATWTINGTAWVWT